MEAKPHPKFSLNLDPETRARLDALGRETERSTGAIIRLALRGFLEAADHRSSPLLKNGRERDKSRVRDLRT